MKKIVLGGGVLIIGFVVAAYAFGVLKFGTAAGTCQVDQEITKKTRTDISIAGLEFVRAVLGNRSEIAYASLTQEAQRSLSREKFELFNSFVQRTGPFSSLHIDHTYFLRTHGEGSETRAICGLVSGDQWVAVTVKPGVNQAHLVISAQTINNSWAFNLWLIPERDVWRVQYINMNASKIVGLDSEALLNLARKQRDIGHMFNGLHLVRMTLG